MALPSQWFYRYRAFATGIVVAGSSIGPSSFAHRSIHTCLYGVDTVCSLAAFISTGGAIASLVYREMLTTIGLRKSLAIFTAIDAVSFTAGYLMMDERRPASKRTKIVWFDRAFFRDPVFWSLALCFFFTVLCVFCSIRNIHTPPSINPSSNTQI